MKIVVLRESRPGEARVALTPKEVRQLVAAGHTVSVQNSAGQKVGFEDLDYIDAGANIIDATDDDQSALEQLLAGQHLILRVKRAKRDREILEARCFKTGQVLIGFLDPLDVVTSHVQEWKNAGVEFYSLDNLNVPADDPMNALAPMSRLSGKLAVKDAISQLNNPSRKKAFVIGLGQAGGAAVLEAKANGFEVFAAGTNFSIAESFGIDAKHFCLLDNQWDALKQRDHILPFLLQADIVIAATRQTGKKAPILIDQSALSQMKSGTVVVDLARSEGGNVEGSANDQTINLPNGVIITNNTGYPKKEPSEASKVFAKAMLAFIENYLKVRGG